MADLNETPRQKMIGILYLVLLGLAATTITDHVLDAFYNIQVSLDKTTSILKEATENRFTSFEGHELKDDPKRAQPYWERAQKVKAACADLDLYLTYVRNLLVTQGGGYKHDSGRTGEVAQSADIDLAPRVMVNQHRADTLKEKILATRKTVLELMTEGERRGSTVPLDVVEPPKREGIKQTWANDCFGEGIPLTAALTAVSKIEMDLKNTENSVVRKILSGVNQQELTLDDYEVIAVPESKYVLVGQQYKAEVFLTAFSSTQSPEIVAGGSTLKVENGKGIYNVTATGEGLKKYSAVIRIKGADGSIKEYKTKEDLSYMVAKPSVTISATKMLVFYIGVDNPVAISAASVGKESLRPTISGAGDGSITGANGDYVVNVKKPGTVTVSVSGELEKGKQTVLGSTDFKCKPIPAPHPLFCGKASGEIPILQLKGGNKVFAAKSEDFDFDAKFNVTSFKMYVIKPHADAEIFNSSSEMLNAEMLRAIGGVTLGTRVVIDDIFAIGPDKLKRQLPPIVLTAK